MIPGQTLCPGCGVAHFPALAWKHAGCVVVDAPKKVVDTGSRRAAVVVDAPGGVSGAEKANKGTRHGKYSDHERRRQYQAAWARKQRAERAQRKGGV